MEKEDAEGVRGVIPCYLELRRYRCGCGGIIIGMVVRNQVIRLLRRLRWRMNKSKGIDLGLLLVVACVSVLAVNIVYVFAHESTHATIYNNHGYETEVKYNFLPGKDYLGRTVAELPGDIDKDSEEYRFMMFQHHLNEIIGYHFIVLINTLIFCSALIAVAIVLAAHRISGVTE